jgi:glycosyltransferase involved in cell wall biosynthesis
MRIGIDTLSIVPGEVAGGTTYLTNLIQHLAEIDDDNRYVLFLSSTNAAVFETDKLTFERVVLRINTKNRLLRTLFEQLALPILTLLQKIDVMFFPGNIIPLFAPCKSVLTVHDLSTEYYMTNFPEYAKEGRSIYAKSLAWMVKHSCSRADRIITDSDFSKAQITKHFAMDRKKIAVVTLGSPHLERVFEKGSCERILQRYDIDSSYVLYVGTLAKHKNLERLLEAFAKMKRGQKIPHKLVLAGRKGSGYDDLLRKIRTVKMGEDVVLTGYVPDADLQAIYSNADLFIFPSLYEGFGLPLLEAMSYGVPVVSSNAGPLPEVAGNAALFFDPLDVDAMAQAIEKMLKDLSLRSELIKRGYERVKDFSWEDTARKTLAVFEEVYRSR